MGARTGSKPLLRDMLADHLSFGTSSGNPELKLESVDTKSKTYRNTGFLSVFFSRILSAGVARVTSSELD